MDQLSPYLPGVLLAYATFFVGLASPGPNILAVLGTSMSVGRRSGLALALGVAAGSFCWAMLSVVGLSALIASYAAALRGIKVAGGLYLLWLAYKTFRSALSTQDLEARTLAGSARGPLSYTVRGLTIQMTNPKARSHGLRSCHSAFRPAPPCGCPCHSLLGHPRCPWSSTACTPWRSRHRSWFGPMPRPVARFRRRSVRCSPWPD